MKSEHDQQVLCKYAAQGSEEAFAEALLPTRLQATVVGLLFLAGIATSLTLGLTDRSSKPAASRAATAVLPSSGLGRELSAAASPGNAGDLGSTNTALGRLAAWLQHADATYQPFAPSHFDEQELSFLVWSLPAADYPAAWRLREGLKVKDIRERFERVLLPFWAELDPRAALAAAQTLAPSLRPGGKAWDPAVQVLQTWARSEPAAALGWIHQFVPREFQASALAALLPEVARSAPQTALAALAELPARVRNATFKDVLRQWAQVDPAAVAQYTTNLPMVRQRAEAAWSVAAAWSRQDLPASLAWVQSLPAGREQEDGYSGVFVVLSRTDPAQAAALLAAVGRTNAQVCYPWASRIAENLAGADPAAAAEWARQLPDARLRQDALQRSFDRWSAHDPGAAAAWAVALPADPARQDYLERIAAGWAASDSQAAVLWVNGLPAGPEHEAALKGLCNGMAINDPVQAAAFVAKLPAGEVQSQTVAEVVHFWANTDPKAAAQWVAAFPEGEARSQAASALLDSWVTWVGDPASAAQWLQGLPAGLSRDRAAQAFVGATGTRRPDLAAPWVSAFTDEAERNQQMETLGRRWLALDPVAARQWLQTTSLPEATKRKRLGQ
jgi:hypothetical protein